jgi:hypothetical protein
MSNLESQFKEFLHNIEPDEKAVKYAQKAHEPLREYLSSDKEFAGFFIDSFLYGSYRRQTAVGDIKDVDIVILTNFSEEDKPNNALQKLKSALARYYEDPENPEYQRRSIRVNDPLPGTDTEMTLDVIPAILMTDDESPLKVPDREVGEWIWSHPKGHMKHTSDLNKDNFSEGRFVPLVKIVRWWWKHQCEVNQPEVERPKPKGFWLECLTAENFDTTKHDYADHFIALLQNVYSKYKDEKSVPELDDPGLINEKIKSSMTNEEFAKFIKILKTSLELATNAANTVDDAESSEKWQEVLGPKFPIIKKTTETNDMKKNGPTIITHPPKQHYNA